MGLTVLLIVLPIVCYLVWLFGKLQRLSRQKHWLRSRLLTRGAARPARRTRSRHHRKE